MSETDDLRAPRRIERAALPEQGDAGMTPTRRRGESASGTRAYPVEVPDG
jgi:hypothetical protein